MAQPLDYRGCRVVIYNETNELPLGESTITKFNQSAYIVTMVRPAKLECVPDRVVLHILHPAGLHEYQGSSRQRNYSLPELEIALHHGIIKNERIAPRYPLMATVTVERLLADRKTADAQVTLLNLSSGGCMIQAAQGAFYPGDQFRVHLPISGGEIPLLATVVRISPAADGFTDYGCSLSPV